jgi:hypothetical protein
MFRAIVIEVACAVIFTGCVDNELSVFIEHVKIQPKAPDCTSSAGDNRSSGGLLDLAFDNPYTAHYLVTNALIPRENTSNFVVESNGVTIEGMEVYVRRLDGSLYGTTEYYEFEFYIPPESSDVAFAVSLPLSVVRRLASPGVLLKDGCLPLNSANYPGTAFNEGLFSWLSSDLGTVYSEVRFLGHTAGGTDVETQVFTFPISLCCGCLVNWLNCLDPCARYCQEPEQDGMCADGIANGGDLYDCRALYYNPQQTWTDPLGGCTNGTSCNCVDDCAG